jgi:thioesterase domain-containing protein/acyl carrier protein
VPAPRTQSTPDQPLVWLLFLDRAGVGADLAARLAAQGQGVVTVEVGRGYQQTGTHAFRLAPDRPEDYDALVQALAQAGQMPDRIVHLWPVTAKPRQPSAVQWDDETQALGFYSLLYLAQALNRQELDKTVELAVVANGLVDVRGDEPLDPAKATLAGISRVIPQEVAGLRCRVIDVDLSTTHGGAIRRLGEHLVGEVMLPVGEPAVAYRGAQRWVQSYAPLRLPAPVQGTAAFRAQGVYLITGGLGEVSYALATYLAEHFQARLVLTARSTLPPRGEWAGWLAGHPEHDGTSRRIRRVQALEEMGAEVVVASADVADARQMHGIVEQTYARFGALHGVIHAAGTVAGTRLAELDREQCELQFHAKGRGLAVLAQVLRESKAVQEHPLDFCLVTSSLSTVLGGLGYAAYAAANAYMDAFVHRHNRDSDRPWTAVDWDAWHFAAPDPAASHLSSLTELAMTPAEGVETLARILAAAPGSQVVVSTGDLEARLDQWVRLDAAAMSGGAAQAAQAIYQVRADGQEYVAPRNASEEALAKIWGNLLGIQEVGIHDSFFDLGGSSLVAVRLFDQIERRFGVKLPLATLFDAPTVAQQAALLGEVDLPVRQTPKAAQGWSPLVTIQPQGTRPPLFCVHAAGGNVLIYRDLARHLGQDQPVYGLQAQGLDGKQPVLGRVEEMAALYVREIQMVQPHGPYLLAGYCMGGTVALEMAQQLAAAGEKVVFLGLFETYNWRNMQLSSLGDAVVFFYQKLEFHLRNFMQLNREGKKTFFDEKLKVAQSRKQVVAGMILARLGWLRGRYAVADLLPAKVWEVNDQAALDYVPRLYAGKITHFRPAKEYRCHMGPALGWDPWAAEVETHRVAAYPAGMLVEPFVAGLAEHVQDCIERALAEVQAKPAASEPVAAA